jgi:hypothetical protein
MQELTAYIPDPSGANTPPAGYVEMEPGDLITDMGFADGDGNWVSQPHDGAYDLRGMKFASVGDYYGDGKNYINVEDGSRRVAYILTLCKVQRGGKRIVSVTVTYDDGSTDVIDPSL